MNDFDNGRIRLMQGDCLERMKEIPDQSIDLILTDPPYGTTSIKWDSVIPFESMWIQIQRIIKPQKAIVLFSSQPYTSFLITSAIKQYKYSWIWHKNTGSGVGNAKIQPLRYYEDICVFGFDKIPYNPQPTPRFSKESEIACRKPIRSGANKSNHNTSMKSISVQYDPLNKNPSNVLEFKSVPNAGGRKIHPTQKPVALLEYLIRTYTQEDEIVLDFTYGSCSTGIAAVNTNRRFIGIELDEAYYQLGLARVQDHLEELAGRMI